MRPWEGYDPPSALLAKGSTSRAALTTNVSQNDIISLGAADWPTVNTDQTN
jgi:hypothetical protein